VSGVAALSRIVTLENATLTVAGGAKGGAKVGANSGTEPLTIQATLQTYRYMDENAAPSAPKPGAAKPGAAKK